MVDSIVINKDEPTTAEKPVEEAQVETTQEEVAATPEAEKILGKFDTQEDLEKAYKELESKIGSPKEETKEEPTLDIPEGNAEEVVEAAGLDMESLQQEFSDKGELTAESLAKLEKVGINKDIVDSYIQGQQAVAQQIETDIKSIAGGNEGYTEMIAWAKENLSAEEVSAYNRVVNGRDIDATKMAVQGLKARMGGNAEPNLVRGKAAISQSQFDSQAQITEAMKDPRYAKDPAYRDEVIEKINRSDLY
jgi:hypothetical protein